MLHVPTVGWTGQQQSSIGQSRSGGVIDGYEGRPWSGGGSAHMGNLWFL